jgi:hypothetical protein
MSDLNDPGYPRCGGHHEGPCRDDRGADAEERRAFAARVVETARLFAVSRRGIDRDIDDDAAFAVRHLNLAEAFELAAKTYLDEHQK